MIKLKININKTEFQNSLNKDTKTKLQNSLITLLSSNFIDYDQINKITYNKLTSKDRLYNWPAYTVFTLPWTTAQASRAEIEAINKGIVYSTERSQKLYGLSQYITNYTQFAIPSL